jgi:hypothetical protein
MCKSYVYESESYKRKIFLYDAYVEIVAGV